MNKVLHTKEAESDLRLIYEYIKFRLHNEPAAEKLTDLFDKETKRIQKFPTSCQAFEKYRRAVVKNYIMFYEYRERENTIIVHRVMHGTRNYTEFI